VIFCIKWFTLLWLIHAVSKLPWAVLYANMPALQIMRE